MCVSFACDLMAHLEIARAKLLAQKSFNFSGPKNKADCSDGKKKIG